MGRDLDHVTISDIFGPSVS